MTEAGKSSPDLPSAEDRRLQVALPSAGIPTWAYAIAAVAIGGAVMLMLNGQRTTEARTVARQSYVAAVTPTLPPALEGGLDRLGPRPYSAPVRVRVEGRFASGNFGGTTPAFARSRARATSSSSSASPPPFNSTGSLNSSEGAVYRGGFATQPMPGAPTAPDDNQMRNAGPPGSSLVYDSAGAGHSADDKLTGEGAPARASLIRNRPAIVAQGEIVSATLETPVNSDRPGLIRAITSRDVRSFDGSRVLIPRGSRLIGEFRAEQQQGRRRILATWNRLIRPDGVAIRLDSPAADAMGGIGIPGKVNTHFLARFANAALQTAFQVGVNLANRPGTSVIIGNASQMSGMVGQAIIPNADAPPTVAVSAGAAITVFVARDLDFAGVPLVR